jgi:PKD repeat protein
MEKNYLTLQKKRLSFFLTCLFWLLLFNNLNAQTPITMTWDEEAGCQIYKNGDRKDFLEDIANGVCVRVCEQSTVTYSISSNSAWPAVWTVTGGVIQSSSNTQCTVKWGNSGWGFVSVTVTTPTGPHIEEMCIEIVDSPRAQFTILPYDVRDREFDACVEEMLYFSNFSNDGGGTELVSYLWDFGDNVFSSEYEPSHAYMNPGTYKVVLTVTNACGCTHTVSKLVHVNEARGFAITCNSVVCEGAQERYKIPRDIAERCGDAGVWTVIGGTIVSQNYDEVEIIWNHVDDTGFGYVTYDASRCGLKCSSTTIKVPVVKSKGTIVGDAVMCADSQGRYKLPQWPTTDFRWEIEDPDGTGAGLVFTDQRNEIIVQTVGEGDIKLRCRYQNTLLNCGGIAEFDIHVKPLASISGLDAICQNTSSTYTVSNGYTANWTLKSPTNATTTSTGNTFTYNFTLPGKYTLTITGTDFCSPEQPFVIRVDKTPVMPDANDVTGPLKICTNSPVEFGLVNTEEGTVLAWEAINGVISGSNYGEEVTVEFTPGFATYGMKVWRENTADPHCTSPVAIHYVSEYQVVLGINGPQNDICASSTTNYNVTYSEGEIYEWSVYPAEAGSVSSGQGTNSISVLWNQIVIPGTQVRLKVRKCAQFYNDSVNINVILAPAVTITNVDAMVCPGAFITPHLSSVPALTSGSVTWNFGDGSPTEVTAYNGTPTAHQYDNVGANANYTITATINSPNGCMAPVIATYSFTVMPAPVALVTPDYNTVYCGTFTPYTIYATLQSGYNPTTTIQWYNNGTLLVGQTGNSLYLTGDGNYYAWVANDTGCGTYTNAVRVLESCGNGCNIIPAPTVTLSVDQTNCNTVTATAFTSPAPASYAWHAGLNASGNPANNATTGQFSYSEAGNHTIVYDATYFNGTEFCKISKVESFIIPFIPKIKYSVQCSTTSPGMYEVYLLDNSNYFPSAPADTQTFIVDGPGGITTYPVTVGTASQLVMLPPGNYNVGIKLTKATYEDCEAFENLDLPAIPNVNIAPVSDTCDGTEFSLSPGSPVDPDLLYVWDFGDGSTNLQPEPVKVYGSAGTKTITLRVYNSLGCYSENSVNVEVIENELDGNLTSDSPNCEDNPITITFNNTGAATPGSYIWKQDQTVIATTTSPTLQVNESGSYWVTLTNSYGCITNLDAVPAKFIMVPDAVIEGPDGVCVNQPFTLSGYAGSGNIEYMWYLDGNPITGYSTSATLTDYTLSYASTFEFKVEVRVADGSGGYCSSFATYEVTSYDMPVEPDLDFTVVNCMPYMVKLHADAYEPGTYTWSNGMEGMDIVVFAGGPYQVAFTNLGGCTTYAQFDVPKDPEVYFWIFPKGCYDFCTKDGHENGPFTIIGPSPFAIFASWAWIKDGNIDMSGTGSVADYDLTSSGTYQMTLDNGYCEKTTEFMDVNIKTCDCTVKMEIKRVRIDNKPYCHYILDIHLDNSHGYPITVTLTADNGEGIFVPGTVTVPPGGANFSFNFIPLTFTGGPLALTFSTTLREGALCQTIATVNFPLCDGANARMAYTGNDANGNGYANSLIVAPNPAKDVAGLTYHYANEKAQSRSIEIYSLMGVLLESYTPKEQSGKWTVNMSKYPSGQYIVVMREDGTSVSQKAIVLE